MQVSSGFPDSNRMRSKTSTMGAGIISGKAFLDMDWIAEAMSNGEDKRQPNTYPGGAREENHDAMPGALSMGLKCVRAAQGGEGDTNEMGIVSVAGINTEDYASQRSMEGQWYFQGVVATEQRVSGHHMDANTHDPNHGYATVRVGVTNVPVNGPSVLYAGQLACWRMPPCNLYTGRRQEGDFSMDMEINQRATNGDPNTQFRFEIVPFDHRDFTMYTAGALATCAASVSDPTCRGICDVPFSEFFRWQGVTEVPTVTHEQEEAAGRKYGFIGAGLAFVETLVQEGFLTINFAGEPNRSDMDVLAEKIGLWSTDSANHVDKPYYKALENMFFMDAIPVNGVPAAKVNFERANGNAREAGLSQTINNDPKTNYAKLRVHLSRFTDGALMGSWYDKTSKIIGRACNTAAPRDMCHLLVGHTAL